MTRATAEDATRAALAWAIPETVIRLPLALQKATRWNWDEDDRSLFYKWSKAKYRFHVSAEVRGARKVRIAVMSVEDDSGSVEWEADMPVFAS